MKHELQDKYIRFDWAIKRLLRQKANFDVLEGFLTVFLGERITNLTIIKHMGIPNLLDSTNLFYLHVTNSFNETYLIEIQNLREINYLERNTFSCLPAITQHISLGEQYYKVKKIYSISILYFDIGKGSDYLYHGQNNFIGVHTGDQLQVNVKEQGAIRTRMPAEIFPEYILIRVNEFDKVAVTPMEEWMKYLKDGVIRPETTAPGLNEAREKLKYYSMTSEERNAYDEHLNAVMIQNDVLDTAKLEGRIEGRAEGREEGLAEGRAEGRAEAIRITAKGMKDKGIDLQTIADITGLPLDEILKL